MAAFPVTPSSRVGRTRTSTVAASAPPCRHLQTLVLGTGHLGKLWRPRWMRPGPPGALGQLSELRAQAGWGLPPVAQAVREGRAEVPVLAPPSPLATALEGWAGGWRGVSRLVLQGSAGEATCGNSSVPCWRGRAGAGRRASSLPLHPCRGCAAPSADHLGAAFSLRLLPGLPRGSVTPGPGGSSTCPGLFHLHASEAPDQAPATLKNKVA